MPEEQLICKIYYAMIAKSSNNLRKLPKVLIGCKVVNLLVKEINYALDYNSS